MKDFIKLYLIFVVVTWILVIIVGAIFATESQKDLPRDQYCTIIAVPENDLEK